VIDTFYTNWWLCGIFLQLMIIAIGVHRIASVLEKK